MLTAVAFAATASMTASGVAPAPVDEATSDASWLVANADELPIDLEAFEEFEEEDAEEDSELHSALALRPAERKHHLRWNDACKAAPPDHTFAGARGRRLSCRTSQGPPNS